MPVITPVVIPTIPKTPTPKKLFETVIIPPPITPTKQKPKEEKITQKAPSVSFTAELRRAGKFQAIGKASTAERATALGKEAARRTLGASIRVKTPKGSYLTFAPSDEFRLSKKSPTVLVQRQGARLTTATERKEFKMARKAKRFSIW
jgi:hypothetical protein